MKCAWQSFINILPVWMRETVHRTGREDLQELRMRINAPPELIKRNAQITLEKTVSSDDLNFVVNVASRYSPWSATTVSSGFITAPGGHRIGLCGEAVVKDDVITGIQHISSLCIRIARDFPGIADKTQQFCGSVLIIGPPGCGKTTLLRDMLRIRSNTGQGAVAVVDERQEVFPLVNKQFAFPVGKHTDVLTGCNKQKGIEIALRNLGPKTIAVDEISAENDCKALLQAGWCGVKLIATAHAGCKQDLYSRPIYKPLIETALFDTLIILHPDKSWTAERLRSE